MILMTPIKGAAAAAAYFGRTDAGYYLDDTGLRREWGGRAAARLGLDGPPAAEQFERLLQGRHPQTGQQLTALLRDDHLAGWDFTARLPKGVTTALEGGDDRIREALWDAANEAMAEVERHGMTRVRKGGQDGDRTTGNMAWLAVEHPETRPARDDGMPDWDRHLHFVVANVTHDDAEGEWKALKVHDIFRLRKFFSHQFDLRMAARLTDLGYEIETKLKPGRGGGLEYHTWDIKAAPGHEAGWKSVNAKNSRRHQEVEDKEQELVAASQGQEKGRGNPEGDQGPDRLAAVAQYKLAATTRRAKRTDLTLAGLRDYWHARLTPPEGQAIAATIAAAQAGANPAPEDRAEAARAHAIAHHFERHSVVDFHDLVVTAIEKSMGAARPEDFAPDAWRAHGLLFHGDDVTTREVLDQEERIIGFARGTRGCWAPLGPAPDEPAPDLAGLSPEQQAAVRHVWKSCDQVILVRGGAGTGKTTMMRPALEHLGVPAVLLAPSADASRGQLRQEGFADANTVAAFLGDPAMQERARRGVIWVDEAGLLPIRDLDRLAGLAQALRARLVLQGDPDQHRAVQRHGNMLEVLADFAGLPVAKLSSIQRQQGTYAKAVAAIRDGDVERGDTLLRDLGWVVEGDGHAALVAEYARALDETKPAATRPGAAPKKKPKSILVVDPTHKDGDRLTAELRAVRRARGLIAAEAEERPFVQLTPLNWTAAQKRDGGQYAGDEVVQFFRHSGPYKAGQRVAADALLPDLGRVNPDSFGVFRPGTVRLAPGDVIRITSNGRDQTGKHRVDNGRIDTVRGFTRRGDLVLANGWVLGKDFAHLKHGLVQTSHATQSKTEDIVLAAMNRESLGAMSAAQAYVTISRGRERGMIFTDLPREELLRAASRGDERRSATEVFGAAEADPAATAARAEQAAREWREFQERTARVRRDDEARRQREASRARAAAVAARARERREVDYGR